MRASSTLPTSISSSLCVSKRGSTQGGRKPTKALPQDHAQHETVYFCFPFADDAAIFPSNREVQLLDEPVKTGLLPETVRYVLHTTHANLNQNY